MKASISVALLVLISYVAAPVVAAQLEVVTVHSRALARNPLGDPDTRRIAVYVPDQTSSGTPLPQVVFLTGWGDSAQDAIAKGHGAYFLSVVDRLEQSGHPVRIAVVDGHCRYGGNQFLNSSATGRYEDYVVDDVVSALAARFRNSSLGLSCVIAGHSSGGFGALRLGIDHHAAFPAVVALSPDSDFEFTHKPLVLDAAVKRVTAQELLLASAPHGLEQVPPTLPLYILGLSAMYAPTQGRPRHFEWIYDARGTWRPEVWQRWLDADPLTIVARRPGAFAPEQRVYLEGASHDEFGANIGARRIYEILRNRRSPVVFHETPGHHADNLADRLTAGLTFALASGGNSR